MADNKPLTYRVFSDLTSAVKGMADRISLGRPKTIEDPVNSIISVELPNTLQPRFAGSPEMSIETFGYIKIYVRAKTDGTMNVGTQTAIVDKVKKLFPIKGEVSISTKPEERYMGFDGFGFHVTQVMFNIRTLININNQ